MEETLPEVPSEDPWKQFHLLGRRVNPPQIMKLDTILEIRSSVYGIFCRDTKNV